MPRWPPLTTSPLATSAYPDPVVSPSVNEQLLQSASAPLRLRRAVDELARLLSATGAMVYLLDEAGEQLRWAYDSGIDTTGERSWIRALQFPVGVGLFGLAVRERRSQRTADYLADARFAHAASLDRFVSEFGARSVVVAPLIGVNGPLGAIGAFAANADAFDERDMAMLEVLAEHAALAVDNAILIEQLGRSQAELQARASEIEESEARYRESEERYRVLVENSPDMIAAVDTQGRISYVSGRSAAFVGWAPGELIGRPAWEIVDAATRQVMLDAWRRRDYEPEIDQQYRVSLMHRDGRSVPVEIRSIGVVVDDVFVGSLSSIRDMSERDRMERDLRRNEAELAASQERAKLAQELHDSVTQALFSMTLTTRSAEMLLERDPSRVAEKLTELRGLATDALAEMRALIFELRPGALDQDGLLVALRKHAAAVQGRTGLPVAVDCSCDIDDDRLPAGIEESLYRIGQEALHDVVKHAKATEARIQISRDEAGLLFEIIDNGRGFDPARVPSGHLGLEGMRTRADRIGATLDVDTGQGRGTRVAVTVPGSVARVGEAGPAA
jgi:PAS domain S-box-containing protein